MSESIEDLRKLAAALEAELEQDAQAPDDAAELRAQRQRILDLEAVKAAREKHGKDKIAEVETCAGIVIVRAPNPMIFRRFIALGTPTPDDVERLVIACLVHPDRAAFQVVAEQYPAIPIDVAAKVLDLAKGVASRISEKR